MINDSWPLRPLGELFEIGAGKTMSAAARAGKDKTPFLRTSNVLWDDIDLTTVDEMAIPADELPSKLLRPGDLLVCEGGEIGRAAIWNGEMEVVSFQNHLHRLRPLVDDVDPRFYVYFLQCAFTQLGIFEGAGNKTTIPNLSRNRLAALDVPHPELGEQRDHVRALARVREAMKLHDRSAIVAQDLKRAAMRALFTKGLRDEAQKETEIGPVPESWAVGRLDRHATVVSTRMSYSELETMQPTEDGEAVIVLGIKVADMNLPGNEVELTAAILEKRVPRAIAQHRCAPPRTIIFPKRGAAIATNKKRILNEWTAFDPNVIGVIGGDDLDQNFLFHWFQTFDLRTITEPGPTPQLNKKNLEPLIVPLPPTLSEQHEIVAILDAVDRKIDLHRRKLVVLDELFKVLLYALMTGEIRVADLDLSGLAPKSTAEATA